MEVLANQLAQRTGGVGIKIYPRGILFREGELWTGLTSGTLEIAVLPLARLRALDPIFAAPTLPGLAATEDRAHALSKGPAMEKIRAALEARGVRVLADMWVPGVFLTEGRTCLGAPDSLKDERVAAGGRMAGDLAMGQGAELAPMELGDAPQLLDGREGISVVVAPELDLIDGGAPKARTCVTLSNGIVPWFDYEPILITQKAWNLLTPSQGEALTEAAAFAESYGRKMMNQSLQTRLQGFAKDTVTWSVFTEEDYRAWRRLSLPVLSRLVDLPLSVLAPEEDRITVDNPNSGAAPEVPFLAKSTDPEDADPTDGTVADAASVGDKPEVRYVIKRPGAASEVGPLAEVDLAAPLSATRGLPDDRASPEPEPKVAKGEGASGNAAEFIPMPLGLGP